MATLAGGLSSRKRSPALSTTVRVILLLFIAVSLLFLLLVVIIGVCVPTRADTAQSPTQEAQPTSPSTPSCPTQDERAYLDAIQGDFRSLGTLTIIMSEDLAKASSDLRLYEDELWNMTMENHFYILPRAADRLLEHDAPASANVIDESVHRMVADYKTAIGLYEQAISNLNAADVNLASEYMDFATDDAQYIGKQIQSFCKIQGR